MQIGQTIGLGAAALAGAGIAGGIIAANDLEPPGLHLPGPGSVEVAMTALLTWCAPAMVGVVASERLAMAGNAGGANVLRLASAAALGAGLVTHLVSYDEYIRERD